MGQWSTKNKHRTCFLLCCLHSAPRQLLLAQKLKWLDNGRTTTFSGLPNVLFSAHREFLQAVLQPTSVFASTRLCAEVPYRVVAHLSHNNIPRSATDQMTVAVCCRAHGEWSHHEQRHDEPIRGRPSLHVPCERLRGPNRRTSSWPLLHKWWVNPDDGGSKLLRNVGQARRLNIPEYSNLHRWS